jgi:predicted nucleotidyltransferase
MFSQDFKEFIALLNKSKIEYLIVGGYAVGLHGYPRYTGDIDIWIKTNEANSEKMVKILNEFGFNSYDIKKEDFLKLDNVIQLGYPPYRIDLMMLIDGVTFDECYANRIKKEIDEIEIDFIGYDDLIKNKRASGREKDINDINNLK